jgi:Mlc titration factor MtfA (ptsG expression regulator)
MFPEAHLPDCASRIEIQLPAWLRQQRRSLGLVHRGFGRHGKDVRIGQPQASLLLLGFQHDYFERVDTVLVYPAGFRSPEGWTGPDGVVDLDVGYLGEAWHDGTVILAWDAVLAGGRDPGDGRNVVLHEFAHRQFDRQGRTGLKPLSQSNAL